MQVRLFCRNAPFVQVVRTRSLEAECSGGSCKSELLQSMMTREDTSVNTTLYMLLRAADHVFADFGNFPGTFESHLDEDVARLKQVHREQGAWQFLSGSIASLIGEFNGLLSLWHWHFPKLKALYLLG